MTFPRVPIMANKGEFERSWRENLRTSVFGFRAALGLVFRRAAASFGTSLKGIDTC